MIEKMPMLMQESMVIAQENMKDLIPQIQAISRHMIERASGSHAACGRTSGPAIKLSPGLKKPGLVNSGINQNSALRSFFDSAR